MGSDGVNVFNNITNQLTEKDEVESRNLFRHLPKRHVLRSKALCARTERNAYFRKISNILQKIECDRTFEECQSLRECPDVVDAVKMRWKKREMAKQRLAEVEDSYEVLKEKCKVLAKAVSEATHLVVYTGAGISTAAQIPDYRGPNGIWTRLQQGRNIGEFDLSLAEPTFTHMALTELYRSDILKYVVSQNCDGLHLRAGLPRTVLSELHGNMYIEVCTNCKPHKQYWRAFDVTEYTGRYAHKTQRRCYSCNFALRDTIVHFGERGNLEWPLNWKSAIRNAEEATVVLCLGTSLKVLKKYPWLWQLDKPVKRRAKLFIVNLQWTPKDDIANIKLHGRCDTVMKILMDTLTISVPSYDCACDPILYHYTGLYSAEVHTTSRISLEFVGNEKIPKGDPSTNSLTASRTIGNPKNIDVIRRTELSLDNPIKISDIDLLNETYCGSVLRVNSWELSNLKEFLYYPYESRYVYSGIHSIIPNSSVIKCDNTDASLRSHTSECDYCEQTFKSSNCLFYKQYAPKFLNTPTRFSRKKQNNRECVCICCDLSSDDDSDFSDYKEGSTTVHTLEAFSNDSRIVGAKRSYQPGWFGKGYRKPRRKKIVTSETNG